MFLLVPAYRVVPDKRPLNGCVCVVCVCRISDKTDKSVRLQQFILGYRFFQTRCRNGFGEVKYSVMIL